MRKLKGENISVGIDCEDIVRFKEMADNKTLLNMLFTAKEVEYCMSRGRPAQHFAVRFAGKEAVIKALSRFNIRLGLNRIEIVNDHLGAPDVTLLKTDYPVKIMLSLSHSKNIAIAFVIAIWE